MAAPDLWEEAEAALMELHPARLIGDLGRWQRDDTAVVDLVEQLLRVGRCALLRATPRLERRIDRLAGTKERWGEVTRLLRHRQIARSNRSVHRVV